jgi:SAM-dependent methyltransferase
VEAASLDVIFTSNFFEHLPDKAALRAALAQALAALKPGGHLFCLGPNIRHVPGAYWDFFDHHIALTELSLREVLELTGFHILECRARFLPYTAVGKREVPLWMLRLYLKLPLLWRLCGAQFLVIARKP